MSETFKIHLQGTSDTQQWLKAEGQLRKLDDAAGDFIKSLKQGVGIDLGGKIVSGLAALPNAFKGFLDRGYEFNKVLATTEGGVANVLGKFMDLDEQAAKREASKAMAAIAEWEPKAAGSLQDLIGGFMATAGASQKAGLSVAQNVELVGRFANSLAALGLPAEKLAMEMRAIFSGGITNDHDVATTLGIKDADIRRAKEAGNLYEFLIQKMGKLGDTASGPSVVLSSLSSAIDKAAGSLSRGLFDEMIAGAESLTEALGDPAIKAGLEEAGVGIGKLVAQGVNLSMWAVQNAPLLLQVAEGAVRVGAAIAGIKLATLIAGLVLKAQRWAMVTTAVTANTAALAANTTASVANAAAAPAAATAGRAGGVAMGGAWAAGFKGVMNSLMPAIVIGLTMKLMDQAATILSQFSDWEKQNSINAKNLHERKAAPEVLRDTIEQAATPVDVASARRLGEIMLRDARRDGNEVLINQVNAIMGKFDQLVGKQADNKKAADDAAAAQAAFNAALTAGQAAAGDSAAQIQLAAEAVDALVKKLEAASGAKLDASTFESLLKGIQGLDTSKLDADAASGVAALIEAAGKLRDLKAAAIEEENQMRDAAAAQARRQHEAATEAAEQQRQQKVEALKLGARLLDAAGKTAAARDARARAEALELEAQGVDAGDAPGIVQAEEQQRLSFARQVADLEDEIAARRAAGDQRAAEAAAERLQTLQLARQMEESLGLTRDQAEARAETRIKNERAAREREARPAPAPLSGESSARRGGPAALSAADRWGDLRRSSGLRGDGSSSIDAWREQQKTPLRDTFKFPALDAFASQQAAGVAGGDLARPLEAAAAAAKAAADAHESGNKEAAKFADATTAEMERLRKSAEELEAKHKELVAKMKNSRS